MIVTVVAVFCAMLYISIPLSLLSICMIAIMTLATKVIGGKSGEYFAKQQGISLDASLDFFYHSETYKLMCEGISDMHCMSDEYLVEELQQEYVIKY